MLKRVLIENFQSFKQAEIETGQVTILTGPSNQGKSAIMRAVSAVLFNASGDDFIRWGAKACDVTLEFDDHTVAWHKERGKGGVYTLDGQVFSRTRGAVPEPVAEVLGIRELEIDPHFTLTPQVQGQDDGNFLLNESGSRIARILGKLTKLDVIITAQMKCKNALQGHKRTADTAAEEAVRLEARLNSMPDVDAMRAKANDLAAKMHSVEQMDTTLDQAELAASRLEQAATAFNPKRLLKDMAMVNQALGLLEKQAVAVTHHKDAIEATSISKGSLAKAEQQAKADREAHEKAVEEAGLCPSCPFR